MPYTFFNIKKNFVNYLLHLIIKELWPNTVSEYLEHVCNMQYIQDI